MGSNWDGYVKDWLSEQVRASEMVGENELDRLGDMSVEEKRPPRVNGVSHLLDLRRQRRDRQ